MPGAQTARRLCPVKTVLTEFCNTGVFSREGVLAEQNLAKQESWNIFFVEDGTIQGVVE